MAKRAYLFPGQGSQKVGMGRELYDSFFCAKAVFEEADAALGFSLSKMMFQGEKEELQKTCFAQPAILTHSVAAWSCLTEAGLGECDFFAGHSLGEYSALVAAKALSFTDAVRAVHYRGQVMQEAVPLGSGAMAVVLGLSEEEIQNVCEKIAQRNLLQHVAVANLNGPGQTVISGTTQGVEEASAALKQAGAKRLLPLPVSAPFHCDLMKPAQEKLAAYLENISIQKPSQALVSNVTAEAVSDPVSIRKLLVAQVTAPVRFTQMLMFLRNNQIEMFVEVGPGKALAGITKRVLENAQIYNVEDVASLNVFLKAMNK